MNTRYALLFLVATSALSGCAALESIGCSPNCRSESRSSSSLVGFLYPSGEQPPAQNSIPQLNLPLRVGLAFIPPRQGEAEGLEPARREEILERVRKRFSDRKFVSEIVIVPDYYLNNTKGFEGLQGVQRLYNVDIIALMSYDQVTYRDDNAWSLSYLTIVGAYLVKGSRHDVTTLMDLAVVDSASRSLLLRAGGTDDRHGRTTAVEQSQESRQARGDSFVAASDTLIQNFDVALTQFEADVRSGKANVRVTRRSAGGGSGGGGVFGALELAFLFALGGAIALARCGRRGGLSRRIEA